ncbi:WD domain-containing protein [Blastomyces dermatitidis ER-3]|uniref:WD domain-containing protein n=1 Tax=Ajellomyces dermatitidis (strain ER-3 / ATCC MYA-2586) TaxID=559297 RepID=A0ABP2ER90_AJEDR|nr:WD domain-containing protein [Blastomyces dermatitidis ER-3]EEQ86183.2 WD domain-containing protein [Blastomyces dermatitidis ER-3]
MKSLRRNLKVLQKPFTNGSSNISASSTLIHDDGDKEHFDAHEDPDSNNDDGWKGPIGLNLLHEPENPRVDLIFVHGLGGGSRKTWSLTKEMKHFWPKSWLPEDPAFKDVRIHSFGYSSDWHKGKDNAMNILDYAMSLLTAIELRPGFGIHACSIKSTDDDIAKRICTFYFIATPHLGSDSAELLTKIFHVAYGSRSYVSDLERRSSTIMDINGQFRLYASDLEIWSFYETMPLTMGFFSKIIVSKDFAILGYQSEKQIPMTADHRSICKFNTAADTNYRTIRDALALTVRGLTKSGQRLKEKRKYEQMKTLREYLGVSSAPKEDLTTVQDSRLPGTCEWLSTTASYLRWRNNSTKGPSIYWLSGNPGVGKSVLAGYVIEMLEEMGSDMASRNERVKDMLLGMHSDGVEFDKGDERTIWRKVFLSGVFQTTISPQYWIIDALDECADFASFFGLMLAKLDDSLPLRILITSRTTAGLQRQFSSLGSERLFCEQISAADTLHDIRVFVDDQSMLLEVDSNHRVSLVERILEKSNDSFLWTAIVLQELLKVHGQEDINQVLEEVPQEMEPLYLRILESIIQIVYITVREFLVKGGLQSEFAVDVEETHTRIAKTCLVYLTGPEMDPPPPRMRTPTLVERKRRSEFAVYAIHSFSDHLAHSNPVADEVLDLLETFLGKNVLSWVQAIAENQDLTPMFSVSRNLSTYLDNLLRARRLEDSRSQVIRDWTKDLIRIATKFGDAMLSSPCAIHRVVFPFCPVESSVYGAAVGDKGALTLGSLSTIKRLETYQFEDNQRSLWNRMTSFFFVILQFGLTFLSWLAIFFGMIFQSLPKESKMDEPTDTRNNMLSIVGHSNARWDDLFCRIHFTEGARGTVIARGDEYFAYRTLDHDQQPLENLVFKPRTDLMASHVRPVLDYGTVRIWNIRNGEILYQFELVEDIFWLSFYKDYLLAVGRRGGCISSWSLADGSPQAAQAFDDLRGGSAVRKRGSVSCISISPDWKTLAVAYHSVDNKCWPITLWGLEDETYIGRCGKEGGEMDVRCLLFNPDPNCGLLAVYYNSDPDGELIILNTSTNITLQSVPVAKGVKCLSSSSDGHILLRTCKVRDIVVYEFKTLNVLYYITTEYLGYHSAIFGNDNLHFFEFNERYCNVWEPVVLSQRRPPGTAWSKPTVESVVAKGLLWICSMTVDSTGKFAFCGTNEPTMPLFSNMSWRLEAWCVRSTRSVTTLSMLLLLISPDDGKCLLATKKNSYLVSVIGEIQVIKEFGPVQWIQHPFSPLHIISVAEGTGSGTSVISIHTWSDLALLASAHLDVDLCPSQTSPTDFYTTYGNQMLVHLRNPEAGDLKPAYCFDWSFLEAGIGPDEFVLPYIAPIALSDAIYLVLGICESKLVFCNKDGWVCSSPLENIHGPYQRHFFIPRDWIDESRALYAVTAKGDLVLGRGIELAVVKRGLEYVDRSEEIVEVLDFKSLSPSIETLVEKHTVNMVSMTIRIG